MADIDVERKGPSIWPWVIGLLVLALLIWAVAEMVDTGEPEMAAVPETEVATEVQPNEMTEPEPVAQGPVRSVAEIIESPATWTGKTFMGEVQVADVVSDRLFWITDQGERLAVVIQEPGAGGAGEAMENEPLNIEQGQTLRIREAVVRDPAFLTNLGELEPETERLLNNQQVFLVTDAANINTVGQTGSMQGQENQPVSGKY